MKWVHKELKLWTTLAPKRNSMVFIEKVVSFDFREFNSRTNLFWVVLVSFTWNKMEAQYLKKISSQATFHFSSPPMGAKSMKSPLFWASASWRKIPQPWCLCKRNVSASASRKGVLKYLTASCYGFMKLWSKGSNIIGV